MLWKPAVLNVLQRAQRRLRAKDTDREFWDRPLFSTEDDKIVVGMSLSNTSCRYERDLLEISFDKVEESRTNAEKLFREMGLEQRKLGLLQLTSFY